METNTSIYKNLFNSINGLEIIESRYSREQLSKDFFDYSPILKSVLKNCCADLVVRPSSIDDVLSVANICQENNIPVTIRGLGTGNYGQAVPLNKGIVMQMNKLDKIEDYDPDTGYVTVQTGCLLSTLNNKLLENGRELRLFPSTWKSASIGGFISGGSGGIGSLQWGFLRDPGNLIGLNLVTMQNPPRLLSLDETSSEPINHAYGTNGIITSLILATANKVNWQVVRIDCNSWFKAFEIIQQSIKSSTEIKLATLFQKEIIDELPIWCGLPAQKHTIFFLASKSSITTLNKIALKKGGEFKLLGQEKLSRSGLRELTWNHTTLHMRKKNSNWTYLQMLLPLDNEESFTRSISANWGEDILWHIEGVYQNGSKRLAALPLVKWKNKKSLYDLINECKEQGAVIFNPHVYTVEDGGLGVIDADQVNTKLLYDPQGLLNPGKLKGWDLL
tara:strand:+ start:307 stop:1647 length:1341 start_codon:yes stop_codon:yes gene_type:complete